MKADSQNSQLVSCCYCSLAGGGKLLLLGVGLLLLLPGLSLADAVGAATCGRSLGFYVSIKMSGNVDEGVFDLWVWKIVIALAGSHQTLSAVFLIWTFGWQR